MKKLFKIIGKILAWIIGIVVISLTVSTISHNILKVIEMDKYKIGQTITVEGKNMQAYVTGSGDKTIVLLSGLGTASPIIDFMPLAERLGKDYKVVILEYFGYGFSDTTKKERSNKNMVNEIRSALTELNVSGPYILMPHSISGIYAMYYAKNYPDEVEAIIGIDESVPNQTKVEPNVNMSPSLTWLNTLGILRDFSYLSPSPDDGMNENNYYSEEQVKVKKMATIWNNANVSVINEMNMVNTNTEELYDVSYPKDLPVLSFLSKDTVETESEWLPLHEALISNKELQKVVILEGGHYLHWTSVEKIVEMTKDFLSSH